MNALPLGTSAVRQLDGLFSLNDLHKAAGGEEKHAPTNFMRLDTTQALISEISNSADVQNYIPSKSTRGKFGGTYVCRELVYAYAMWISAKFSLEVIRAFDAQHAQPAPKALPKKSEGIPPERQSAINRRAWELAQGAYENFRERMAWDVMVSGGHTAPDKWEPVECTTDVMESIEAIAHTMEAAVYALRQHGRTLAGLVGKDYDREVERFLSPDEKSTRFK